MKCSCGHDYNLHLIDAGECVCSVDGCSCLRFRQVFRLLDPFGDVHEVMHGGLRSFVESHADLFEPEDVLKRYTPTHLNRPAGEDGWTRADRGLNKVLEDVLPSWKEWKLLP